MSIEKFSGRFNNESNGCTVLINSTIQSIKDIEVLGLYVYLSSKPDTWRIHYKEIMRHFNIGRDKAYKALNSLVELGLLERAEIRSKGKFLEHHYMLYLRPNIAPPLPENTEAAPLPDSPEAVNKEAYITKKEIEKIDTTTAVAGSCSSSENPQALVQIFIEEFPEHPHPNLNALTDELLASIRTFKRNWPTLKTQDLVLTPEVFRKYLQAIKQHAPGFAFGEYENAGGKRQKNTMRMFIKWNNVKKAFNRELY